MKVPRPVNVLLVLGVALAPAVLVASVAVENQGVPLYTNADVSKLSPLPQQAAPIAAPAAGDWDVLFRMLDREHERLEAERAYRVEMERLALAREELDRNGQRGFAGRFVDGTGLLFGFPFTSFPVTPTVLTPRQMFERRVRVPLGQRGIASAGDVVRESLTETHGRLSQPPIGRRP